MNHLSETSLSDHLVDGIRGEEEDVVDRPDGLEQARVMDGDGRREDQGEEGLDDLESDRVRGGFRVSRGDDLGEVVCELGRVGGGGVEEGVGDEFGDAVQSCRLEES